MRRRRSRLAVLPVARGGAQRVTCEGKLDVARGCFLAGSCGRAVDGSGSGSQSGSLVLSRSTVRPHIGSFAWTDTQWHARCQGVRASLVVSAIVNAELGVT